MTVLTRDALRLPTLRKKTVEVPELGGEVVVRGMLARERLGIGAGARSAATTGERLGAEFEQIARLLAEVVCGADGQPLLSCQEWEVFGGQHFERALELFNECQALSGGGPEGARDFSQASQS